MQSIRKYISENIWIIKIPLSLTVIILTAVYSVPVMDFFIKSSNSHTLSGYADNMNFSEHRDLTTVNTVQVTTEQTPTADLHSEPSSREEETTEKYTYETPEDVLLTESEYLSVFSKTEPAGTVEEVFFRTSGATDTISGISIKNATSTKKPDFARLLEEGPVLSLKNTAEPVVLIFHTHTTEAYLPSYNGLFYEDFQTRSTDSTQNMIRVGEEICKVLENNGIGYIHDKNIYDESYEGAYSRSRVTVEKYLEQYPSIEIVLDVHRDAIYYSDSSHCKPTAEINGRKAAQIMIITGAQEGYISDFPHWEDNLRFALCFQKTAEEMYEGLMKPIYFCQRKYNMDTAKCSLLLEMGTDANTLDEALYSAYMTGQVLTRIIESHKGE